MRKLLSILAIMTLAVMLTNCAYMPGGTDLSDVAGTAGLSNITTGDGTYENYTATGHYTGTEIGIGIGIPYIKILELYPGRSNEDLLGDVAGAAKDDAAEAMINVTPAKGFFWGFIIGLYVDKAEGTGIDLK